jgi:hypothetical protein
MVIRMRKYCSSVCAINKRSSSLMSRIYDNRRGREVRYCAMAMRWLGRRECESQMRAATWCCDENYVKSCCASQSLRDWD